MKKMKKLFSLVMALAMVMSLTVAANAAGGNGTITIQNASKGATYKAYKLFDAKVNGTGGITYTGTIPDTLSAYFTANANGEISAKAQPADYTGESFEADRTAALKAWAETTTVTPVTDDGDGGPLTLTVPYGYYVITSTINSGAAVTVDSTNPNAEVYDKNNAGVPTFPTNAKTADNDIYQLGETVTYTVKLNTVNWVGAGEAAKQVTSYTIKDTATASYLENVTVTGIKVGGTAITVQQFNDAGEITIPWTNAAGESLYNNAAQIEITYTAKVVGIGEGTNTVTASYKTGEAEAPKNVDGDPDVTIYNAKITVTKVDGEGNALAGAGFVLQNADNKYYKKADDNKSISWVDTVAEATELKSTNESNVMVFDGLKNGTYTLIENTVPDGYNKADNKTFTINDGDVTTANLEQATTVTNNAGLELPSTGGIGTTIFTVVGGMLMVGAAVLFITKKRSED